MARLAVRELSSRIGFDFLVCSEMARRSELLTLEAYASIGDMRARTGAITDPDGGDQAVHYLAIYHPLRTLCGPGEFMDETMVHIDLLANGNYPFTSPASWVTSRMPWSPHFKEGVVVCIGDLWDSRGTTLVAHLLRHHARLLNWDEHARGGGYVGWNPEAIAWHREHHGDRPLNEGLVYPEIPVDLVYGVGGQEGDDAGAPPDGPPAADEPAPLFAGGRRMARRAPPAPVDGPLFELRRR